MSGDQYVVYRWRKAKARGHGAGWNYIEISLASSRDPDEYSHTMKEQLQAADPEHMPSSGMFCDYEVQACTPDMVDAGWLASRIKEAGERVWSSQFELLRLQDMLQAKERGRRDS